mmetsp:Transcript_27740/g.27981  ORF Transcript_27740/g.27981 Transcript_27740/m.27981 type:complete len:379 (-) Transcript_27740:310-1446(-)
MFLFIGSLATFLAVAYGFCDNYCNGHGSCQVNDVCACYDNWGMGLSMDSGDCSERICPFEISWVDSPDKTGKFHKYTECAGRGICDRVTGECQCFEGFEGKGCQRHVCPNDCSGHGTCEYIEELGFKSTYGEYADGLGIADMIAPKEMTYYGWDDHKSRACVCDPQYYDFDCSKRMCPYGNDVLDLRDDLLVSLKYQVQRLNFIFNYDLPTSSNPQTFAITFKTKLNETFTTIPIVFDPYDMDDFTNDVQLALLGLPNKVIDGVNVVANIVGAGNTMGALGAQVMMNITFTGNSVQGPQYPLSVETYECFSGCTPKITGLDLQTRDIFVQQSNITEFVQADYNSYECGRRGKCDYTTGLCACFDGYSGENCNTLVTMI